jgi:hypothetical protein
MSERDAPDKRALTLLVQLFGRDVLDRLASAGFDCAAAIARAGADRLAAEGGIPLAVAQRLAAVAEETRGPAPGLQKEPRPGKAGPRKRAGPKAPADPAEAPPAKASPTEVPLTEVPPARARAEDGNPFVDDVALVSWMGFSAHHPGGGPAFSVSDAILDPVEAGAPPAAAPEAKPERPRTLTGSFWSFGRPVDNARPPSGPESEPQAPAGTRRRRKHDDH